MNTQTIVIAKTFVGISLLVFIANWIIGFPEPFYSYLHWVGILIFAAHAVEVLIFASRVKGAPGNPALHYLQLFLFGYFHAETLKKK